MALEIETEEVRRRKLRRDVLVFCCIVATVCYFGYVGSLPEAEGVKPVRPAVEPPEATPEPDSKPPEQVGYVVTEPDSTSPLYAAPDSQLHITRIPPNHTVKVLDVGSTGEKFVIKYYLVSYCGVEGWLNEYFTTREVHKQPPDGAIMGEEPLRLVFAKKLDNIRKTPNGAVLRKTQTGESYEVLDKEGHWYKIKISGLPPAYVHDSVVLPDKEGQDFVFALAGDPNVQNKLKRERILDEFSTRLKDFASVAGGQIVESVSVRGEDDSWSAKLTVINDWHYAPYQVRLQCAQGFQAVFSSIACPENPDLAYISIVDYMGNEVGGSRWKAGSLIWVANK